MVDVMERHQGYEDRSIIDTEIRSGGFNVVPFTMGVCCNVHMHENGQKVSISNAQNGDKCPKCGRSLGIQKSKVPF